MSDIVHLTRTLQEAGQTDTAILEAVMAFAAKRDHENPGAAGTAAGAGGAQSEPDAYGQHSNAQLTKARTLAESWLPVSPCKPESFGDKPKQTFTDHGFEHATTDPQRIDEPWLDTRTCRSTSEQLGTAGSRS